MTICLVDGDVFWGPMACMMRVFSVIFLFLTLVHTTPTITFPINSQVPPVARVSQPFNFTFLLQTFTSDTPMTYALSNAPAWLSLDGITRTLSGTAPVDAADTAPVIQITASDTTGSVTMNTTLVVSPQPAPVVEIPLADQLESLGTSSPPDTILFYVSTPFRFSFDPKTFGDKRLNYYSVTSQNTPLPSWLFFDGSTMTFSGQTPDSGALVQPPQTFGLQLIGSDVLGFAGAAIPFNLVVGNHKLDFINGPQTINATIGTAVDFKGLKESLHLDDMPVNIADITSINATTPTWLVLDSQTLTLSGTPPSDATSSNITVTAGDIYGDIASIILELQIITKIFSGPLEPINATIGEKLSKDLSSSFLNPDDVTVSAQIDESSQWLSFDSETLILGGDVPSDADPSTIQVVFNAASKTTHESESENLEVKLVQGPKTTTSTTTASPTSTTTTAEKPRIPQKKKGLSKGEIAAIVILPLLLVIAILIALCCYKRRKYLLSQIRPISPQKEDISRPMSVHDLEAMVDVQEKKFNRHKYNDSYAYTDSTFVASKRHTGRSMRRTLTESAISLQASDFRDSRSSSARARSFTANAISDYGSSWRSTQDSSYPPLPGTAVPERMTRNFSRKANEPSLRRDDSSEFPMRHSQYAVAPLKRVSKSSIQKTPLIAYDAESVKNYRDSRRRTPNYLGGVISKRYSVAGPAPRNPAPGFSFAGNERLSTGIGHGARGSAFELGSDRVMRNASSWQTIEPPEMYRHSNLSALTEFTDVLDPAPAQSASYLTIRRVPKSPATLRSHLSMSSGGSRSDSRRVVGTSPFFGDSSRSGSSREQRRKHRSMSRQDDELPPPMSLGDQGRTQDSLEQSILRGLRSSMDVLPIETPPQTQGGLGISYNGPRESTRQLQNMVSEMSYRVSRVFRNSLGLSDSDSRFHSAVPSPVSKAETLHGDEEEEAYEHEHFGYSPQGQRSARRVSRDGGLIYDIPEPPEGQRSNLQTFTSFSNPNTPHPDQHRASEAQGRFMAGPGRPISIDSALSKKKSLTASRFSGPGGGSDDDNEANHSGIVAFL